jgi:DNA-binding LacI/PurR family transcriptional regulator
LKLRITQSELARKLGLSRSTVAAALNPYSPIKLNQKTRLRIAKAAEKWNYRPDRYARVMRGGKSGVIGMLNFGGLLQVAAERAFYATKVLHEEGWEILAADLSWDTASTQQACYSLIDARVEGVVVAGLNDPEAVSALEQFHASEIPMVALSGNPLGAWAPHFRGDASQAYFQLTRHLLSLGHRRLALMTPISKSPNPLRIYSWAASERARGFEEALAVSKGRIVPAFKDTQAEEPLGVVYDAHASDNPFDPFSTGYAGMKEILAQPVTATAVLCSNDELACGAMQACRDQHIDVPNDIAITGHDDIAFSRYCAVPLTTVRQPNQLMAEAAISALCGLIQGGDAEKPGASQIFPCELIIRASSGAQLKKSV